MKCYALLFFLSPLLARAADLTITVTGIRNDKGKIAALAFTKDQGFPDRVNQAFAQALVKAQKGTVTLTIKNVPPGQVALTVLHDTYGLIPHRFVATRHDTLRDLTYPWDESHG